MFGLCVLVLLRMSEKKYVVIMIVVVVVVVVVGVARTGIQHVPVLSVLNSIDLIWIYARIKIF